MIDLHPTQPDEADSILGLARLEPLFSQEEAETVAELLDAYLTLEDHEGYFFLSAVEEGKLLGVISQRDVMKSQLEQTQLEVNVLRDYALAKG